jgi:hypothetical protein
MVLLIQEGQMEVKNKNQKMLLVFARNYREFEQIKQQQSPDAYKRISYFTGIQSLVGIRPDVWDIKMADNYLVTRKLELELNARGFAVG